MSTLKTLQQASRGTVCLIAILIAVTWFSPLHADDDFDFVEDQVVVKMNPASGATIEAIHASYGTTTLQTLLGSGGIYLLQIASNKEVEEAVAEMVNDPRLLYVEPNFLGQMPEGDPSGTWAWGGHDPQPYLEQYAADMLNLPAAHAITQGTGIVVAVLDTGVQLNHPQLSGHLTAARYDFIEDDNNPADETNGLDDDNDGLTDEGAGHGTHVAGTVHLVAPEARIMPLRVLDSDGVGNDFLLAEAIQYAVANGAEVINLSLGTPVESALLDDVIWQAVATGAVVVAAAGNQDSDALQYPAAEASVLAVTSVGPALVKSAFANYGAWVDIATPGESIRSTFPTDGYAQWSGTSMATSFVSGQAALIRSEFPNMPVAGVVSLIQSTAQPINSLNPNHDGQLGTGLADIGASLNADVTNCGPPITLSAAADAWIEQNGPGSNKGDDSILKIKSQGSADNFRALVRFTLPGSLPAGCVVESAVLRLYSPSWTAGRTLQAIPLTSAWTEMGVTWSNQPATTGTAATTNSGEGYRQWNVAAQVQQMITTGANHGFLIRDAAENGSGAEQQFHSREKGETPPQLVVQFVPGETTDTRPPATVINAGPPATTAESGATFLFSANESGSTFACSLDSAPFVACSSPQSYSALGAGFHTFAVQATDLAGNIDPTAAAHSWIINPNGSTNTVHCGQTLTTSVVVGNDLNSCSGDGLVVGAHGITINLNGRTLSGVGQGAGIRNDNFDGVTISNGTIEGFEVGVLLNGGTTFNLVSTLTLRLNLSGLSLINANNNLLEDNLIANSSDQAIILEGASNNTLAGNHITDNPDGALMLLAGSNNNLLEGNTLTTSSDAGIQISDSNGNHLIANTIHEMSDAAVVLSNAHNSIVRNNDLRLNATGIELSLSTGNVLEANDASHSSGTGIELGDGSLGNTVLLNTASANGANGIYISAEALPGNAELGNLIEGNTAENNESDGIAVTKGGHTLTGNRANDNHGWGIYTEIGNVNGGGNTASGNSETAQCYNITCNTPTPPSDTDPPDTTIISGPDEETENTAANFIFAADEPDITFACSLDGGSFVACASPQAYTGLSAAVHTFAVRASDAAGNVDPTPATYEWTVETPPPNCGPSITLVAHADAWIDQDSPSNNMGSDSILKVQAKSGDNFRALVRFALPALPQGCVVESAALRLYAASWKNGRTLQAMRVTGSWSENSVRWNNQPSTTGPAATTSSGSGYRQWNVTNQVQMMFDLSSNNGFLIRDANESGSGREQQFHSREKGENVPVLLLTFAPAED